MNWKLTSYVFKIMPKHYDTKHLSRIVKVVYGSRECKTMSPLPCVMNQPLDITIKGRRRLGKMVIMTSTNRLPHSSGIEGQ